jgi:hypothetical protein
MGCSRSSRRKTKFSIISSVTVRKERRGVPDIGGPCLTMKRKMRRVIILKSKGRSLKSASLIWLIRERACTIKV